MEPILIMVLAAIASLNLILFFKVWGMTNDTKKIRMLLEEDHPDVFWNSYMYEKRKETKK